jgi:uncharacterized membrane protein
MPGERGAHFREVPLMIDARASVDQLASLLELVGVAIIIGGVIIAGFLFVHSGLTGRGWRSAYEQCRSNLGRGILLGLELLVGADIISTITAPLTVSSAHSAKRQFAGRNHRDPNLSQLLPWDRNRRMLAMVPSG